MPNIAQMLKDEIARVARKEIRKATSLLRADNVRLKRDVAALKRDVAELQRRQKFIGKEVETLSRHAKPDEQTLRKMRITGRMMSKLRSRLRVTQAELGELLGVSAQQVYQYERRGGSLRLRNETRVALDRVRQMGKRQARQALGR